MLLTSGVIMITRQPSMPPKRYSMKVIMYHNIRFMDEQIKIIDESSN